MLDLKSAGLGLVLTVLGLSAPVVAEEARVASVARVSSAMAIAQAGLEGEDVHLILLGLDVLSRENPNGTAANGLIADLKAEARFLIRSDPDLSARLQAMPERASAASSQVTVVALSRHIHVPEGMVLAEFAVPGRDPVTAITSKGELVCSRVVRRGYWSCDPARAMGVLELTMPDNVKPGFMVYALEASTP